MVGLRNIFINFKRATEIKVTPVIVAVTNMTLEEEP